MVMVAAGEGIKYRYMPMILQELLTDLGMTPAESRTEGMTEGGTAEMAIVKEKPAMESVGVQTGTRAIVATATQTEMERSVAVATQTEKQAITSIGTQSEAGIGIERQAMKSVGTQSGAVAIQTARSRGDTPESGYESARSENGGEGRSVRTYAEAASRRARHRTEPEQKEPPRLAPRGPKRGTTMATLPARRLSQVQPGKSMAQSVVIHGVPTHRKIGKMWGWLQEDNRGVEVTR